MSENLLNALRQQEEENFRKANPMPDDPDLMMADMIRTIGDFRNVIVQETEALEAVDTHTFFSLQKRKIDAAMTFENSIKDILRNRDAFMDENPEVRAQLEEARREFQQAAKDNMEALNRMRQSVQRLGSRILEVARQTAESEKTSYSRTGRMDGLRNVSMGLQETA